MYAQIVLNTEIIIELVIGAAIFVATMTSGEGIEVPLPAVGKQTLANYQTEIFEKKEDASNEVSNQETLTTEDKVKEYYKDIPILAEVAFCESNYHHFDKDGEVLRGIQNPSDIGVMQINERYHAGTAAKLGLDIYTFEGNVAYGRYLYEKEGTRPWNYSSACWDKNREVALK
jgi:hypothetical protein